MMLLGIDLSWDSLELASPGHVRAAAKAALDRGETHYTTRPGIVPLRQAIATSFSGSTGLTVDPVRQVLITCGGEEALFVAIHTLVASGDEVLVIGPSPRSDDELVARAGGSARHVSWPSLGSDPGASLKTAISDRTRAVLLRNPSLAGELLEDAAARTLLTIVAAHNATVISIESLADFSRTGHQYVGFARIPGAAERTVTIGDFSAWGMDGWRVGYLIGSEALVAPMTNFKQALSICSPALGQYAALAAATGPQARLKNLRSALDSKWEALVAELARFKISIRVPEAGYHLFIPTSGLGPEPAAEIWKAVAVRVVAGDDFRVPETVRVTLCQPESLLVEAARRVAPLLSGVARGQFGG
ncbi:MAG: pyridoxal phosphate-dependent aminotransferase [Candidatus Dormiibacterota bacterium]